METATIEIDEIERQAGVLETRTQTIDSTLELVRNNYMSMKSTVGSADESAKEMFEAIRVLIVGLYYIKQDFYTCNEAIWDAMNSYTTKARELESSTASTITSSNSEINEIQSILSGLSK